MQKMHSQEEKIEAQECVVFALSGPSGPISVAGFVLGIRTIPSSLCQSLGWTRCPIVEQHFSRHRQAPGLQGAGRCSAHAIYRIDQWTEDRKFREQTALAHRIFGYYGGVAKWEFLM